jgi:hypothetical protein
MSNLVRRLTALANSPKGRRLIAQAQHAAAKPENRRKLEQLRRRLAGRRH